MAATCAATSGMMCVMATGGRVRCFDRARRSGGGGRGGGYDRLFCSKCATQHQHARAPRRHRCKAAAAASGGGGSPNISNGIKNELVATSDILSESEGESISSSSTEFVAETMLPTSTGDVRVRAYRHSVDGKSTEPLALIVGDVEGKDKVPVRVHDACFTGEVLGSLKCDCAQQLELAIQYMRENGPGAVLYLQQEGRGIGLANKIAAYSLQERDGLDTVDANRALGLPDDSREYTAVSNMLEDLGIQSIMLLTNNPRKIERIADAGVKIEGRVPVVVNPNGVGPLKRYLQTKEERMEHILDGSWCNIDEGHL